MTLRFAAAVSALLFSSACFASPAGDNLRQCLGDNTNGKERKELAAWVFVAMAAHPEMSPLAPMDPKKVESIHRNAGAVFTKLIGTSCAVQTRILVKSEGPVALQTAFEHLGRLAMQEIMGHKDVNASISSLERYVDMAKIAKAMGDGK